MSREAMTQGTMSLEDLVNRICADGIAAAQADYTTPDKALHRQGSIEGFQLCVGVALSEHLLEALYFASTRAQEAFNAQANDYWRWRCRAVEIEWVCNVVSAANMTHGQPSLGACWPTARAVIKAAEILGVRQAAGRLRGH